MDCVNIIQTKYGLFSKRLHENILKYHIPVSGSIELTPRCNLNCMHCYINQPVNDHQTKKRELTEAQWIDLINQIVDEGCLWLLFTGGEPFVRKDFLNIYTHAKKKGLLISLFTNGTMITKEIANYLAEWTPFEIEITLYGRTQKTYEQVTGVPGSHQLCYQSIDYLLEHGIPLQLKTVVFRSNKHEVRDMRAFAKDRGLSFRYDVMINRRIDGSDTQKACRLSPQEIIEFESEDEERTSGWRDLWNRMGNIQITDDRLYTCGAGRDNFHIDSFGNLCLCMMARRPDYNLLHGSFHEGWKHFIPGIIKRKRKKPIPCQECDIKVLCDHCPGWADVEMGDVEGHVPYLCEIAHLRARQMGIEAGTQNNERKKEYNLNG